VKVICRGCPADPWKHTPPLAEATFEYATIERKYPAHEIEVEGAGWSWPELDLVSLRPAAPRAPSATRSSSPPC
jgi:hypothetical protein